MNLILCVDDDYGLSFNKRRQSRDKIVAQEILRDVSQIWMQPYSRCLFPEYTEKRLTVDRECLKKAGDGEHCFMETEMPESLENIEKLILFKWNRAYPADSYFDKNELKNWKLESVEEFKGSSHEKITKETYVK